MDKVKDGKRMLMIVDPQIDFITGSLPVPGSVEAMDALAVFLRDTGGIYDRIVITCDRHPLNHSSFREYGGEWPPHCVESSVGAAVWPAVMNSLTLLKERVMFCYKGEQANKEEYSVFSNDRELSKLRRCMEDGITDIDICGLAGDVCVKTTYLEGTELFPEVAFHILENYTAYLDGGNQTPSHK